MSVSEIERIAGRAYTTRKNVLSGATTLSKKELPPYEQQDELLLDYPDMIRMMKRIQAWLDSKHQLSQNDIEWCAVKRSNHDSTHYLLVDNECWHVMTRYKASPQDTTYQQVYHSNDPATNAPEFSAGRVFCGRNLGTGLGNYCAEHGLTVPNLHLK